MRLLILIFSIQISALSIGFCAPAFSKSLAFQRQQQQTAVNPNVTDSMLGWWKLDETTGTNFVDSSGNGYDGTAAGATFSWSAAINNNGLSSPDNSNYGIVTDKAAFDALTNMTVCFWFKESGMTNNQHAVARGAVGGGTASSWSFSETTPNVILTRIVTDGTERSINISVPLDTWTHVAGVYNGSEWNGFSNGVVVATIAATGKTGTNNYAMTILNSRYLTQQSSAHIDDVRWYARALSTNEINTIYNWRP